MSEVSERLAEVAHAKLCRELGACDDPLAYAPIANALAPVVEQMLAEARAEALSVVHLVESDMAEQAMKAWRAADARRGLSDHEALIVHADALTRWSERLRMALKGEDYRDRADAAEREAR